MSSCALSMYTYTQAMNSPVAVQRRSSDTEEEEEDTIEAEAAKKRGPGDDNQGNDNEGEKETANEDTGNPAGAGREEGELCDDDKEAIQATASTAAAAAIEEWGDDQGEEEEQGARDKQKRDDGDDGKESAALPAAGGEDVEEEEEEVEAPLYSAVPPSGQLPPFWAAAQDPSTSTTYYYHQQTGVRSWEPPPLLDLPPPHTCPRLALVVPSSEPQLPPELAKLHAALDKIDRTLPNGDTPLLPPPAAIPSSFLSPSEAMAAVWVELVDEGTGRVYYYNNVSGATQWIMPPAFQGDSRTAWPDRGLQHPVISPCDRDIRMMSHFFDPSTLAANREEAKRKKLEMGKVQGVNWRKVKEKKAAEKRRKASEWLYKE